MKEIKKKFLEGVSPTLRYRNSHQRCSFKKGVLKNLAKVTEKHLCFATLLKSHFDMGVLL